MLSIVDPHLGESQNGSFLPWATDSTQSIRGQTCEPGISKTLDVTSLDWSTCRSGTFRSLFLWSFQNCLEQSLEHVLERHAPPESAHRPMFDYLVGDCLDFVSERVASALTPPSDELQKLSQLNGSCVSELLPQDRLQPPRCIGVSVSDSYEKAHGTYSVVPEPFVSALEYQVFGREAPSPISFDADKEIQNVALEPSVEVRNIQVIARDGETRGLKVLWSENPDEVLASGAGKVPSSGCAYPRNYLFGLNLEHPNQVASETKYDRSRDFTENGTEEEREIFQSFIAAEKQKSGSSLICPPAATLTRATLLDLQEPTMRYNQSLRKRLSDFWLVAPHLHQLAHHPFTKQAPEREPEVLESESAKEERLREAILEIDIFDSLPDATSHAARPLHGFEEESTSTGPNAQTERRREVQSFRSRMQENLRMILASHGVDIGWTLGFEGQRCETSSQPQSLTENEGDLETQRVTTSCAVNGVKQRDSPVEAALGSSVRSQTNYDASCNLEGDSSHGMSRRSDGQGISVPSGTGKSSAMGREVVPSDTKRVQIFKDQKPDTGLLAVQRGMPAENFLLNNCIGDQVANKVGLSGVDEFCSVQEAVRKEAQDLRDLVQFYSVFISECLQRKKDRTFS